MKRHAVPALALLLTCVIQVAAQQPAKAANSAVGVNHVFILLEENHRYGQVIGNPNMPYLNSLATRYAIAKDYYANTHPSIGNYFMLTTGQIITNNDGFRGVVSVDNVVRELAAAGKTWKEYSESLPYQGYDGPNSGYYTQHHNPCSYFADVRNNPAQRQNLVPLTQLATDIANHTLPEYGFIVPDNRHNGHDGTLAQADAWLQANIAPLLHSRDFTADGGGLLIITFDEANGSDSEHGGGHVAWIAIGPNVKTRYPPPGGQRPPRIYQHQSTLRFMLSLLGVNAFPGSAENAPEMTEFLAGN